MSFSPSQSGDAGELSLINRTEASSSESRQSWFDLLPRDVVCDIAGFLSDDCLLSFAGTSDRVCAAVREGLVEGDLEVDSLDTSRWKGVLGGTFVNVTDYPNVGGYGSVPQILKEGRWSKGDISLAERARLTLWDSSLKSLTLNWEQDDAGVKGFMDVAFGDGLKELTVRCGCAHGTGGKHLYDCNVMQTMEYISSAGISVESKVEKLELTCTQSRASRYAILSKFTHLREVTLCALPFLSDDLATKLQQLDRIHLRNLIEGDVANVAKLGQSVSTLRFRRDAARLSAADLQRLSACTRLTALTAALEDDAGTGLAALPSTLRELRLTSGYRCVAPYNSDPSLTTIVRLVKRCPNLSVVNLRFAFLAWDDIEGILEATGPRLREFGISISFKERGLKTLRLIAETIATHNRNLRKLEVHVPAPARFGGWFNLGPDVRVLPKLYRLPPAIAVLRRRVPRLDAQPLEAAMSHLLGYLEKSKDVYE